MGGHHRDQKNKSLRWHFYTTFSKGIQVQLLYRVLTVLVDISVTVPEFRCESLSCGCLRPDIVQSGNCILEFMFNLHRNFIPALRPQSQGIEVRLRNSRLKSLLFSLFTISVQRKGFHCTDNATTEFAQLKSCRGEIA